MRAGRVLLLLAAAAGCGGGGDSVDEEDVSLDEAVMVDDIPMGDSRCPWGGVRVAVGTTQRAICNGQPGAAGPAGEPGRGGPAGPAGQNGIKTTGTKLCGKYLTLPSGAQAGLTHSATFFSDNSVLVTCSVSDYAVGASETRWYGGWTVGASSLACEVWNDSSGAPSGGTWSFQLVNGQLRVTYDDPAPATAADDGAFYVYQTADCTTSVGP